MKIYIGSDHAGFQMKGELISFLSEQGFQLYDCGPEEYNHGDDYPDYIPNVAEQVSNDTRAMGIIIGFTGQGEAMVANRFPHVRCAVYYGGSKHVLTLSRQHNDANVLSIGSNFVTTQEAKEAVLLWIRTEFSGDERHVRRIQKIEKYDNS